METMPNSERTDATQSPNTPAADSASAFIRPWVKNYQPGVPAEIELPTESLVSMFERSVAEAGDAPATEFFGRRTSYRELGEQVSRAAEGLRRLGVRAGDRVALILPNCPQHVVAFYAVLNTHIGREFLDGLHHLVPRDDNARLVIFKLVTQFPRGVQRVVFNHHGAQAQYGVEGHHVLRP